MMPSVRKVEIQALDQRVDKWETIHLSSIQFNDDALYIGGPFQILVDGKVVFSVMKRD